MKLQPLKPQVQMLAAPVVSTISPTSWRSDKTGANARGYNYAWQKAREAFLAAHPLCQCEDCDEGRKRVTAATIVDHKIPHRGDQKLFWDRSNWQAMAKPCHDAKTQRETAAGL